VQGNERTLPKQVVGRSNLSFRRGDANISQSFAGNHFPQQQRMRADAHAGARGECALGAILSDKDATLRRRGCEFCGLVEDRGRVFFQADVARIDAEGRLKIIQDLCGAGAASTVCFPSSPLFEMRPSRNPRPRRSDNNCGTKG
jgi:hypothetical protein